MTEAAKDKVALASIEAVGENQMSPPVKVPFGQRTVSDPWKSMSTLPACGVTKVVTELEDMRVCNLKCGISTTQPHAPASRDTVTSISVSVPSENATIEVEPKLKRNVVASASEPASRASSPPRS